MESSKYDLAVIGTGPAGHHGAIQAAKLGKRVIAIEEQDRVGGGATLFGTIPSKSLREAVLHLTGLRKRTFYGTDYMVKQDPTVQDLMATTDQIVRNETAVFISQLRRNSVELLHGRARFEDPHRLVVDTGRGQDVVEAEKILIAVGSHPARPPDMAFDGRKIMDSNQILTMPAIPRRLMVVGAGIIGVEYAGMFAALGARVTLVDQRVTFLEFLDAQIRDCLEYHMQNHGVELRLGEEVVGFELRGDVVVAKTRSNKELAADCVLYSIGRQGNTEYLNLEAAGLSADKRGRIKVNEHYQTGAPHIYAAGDVIGFPALSATSREQGRRAMRHGFDVPSQAEPLEMPFGIWTIPEISAIGPTERELTEEAVPYEIGIARYREIARGQIVGDTDGTLKILFHRETLKVLAVHIIGEGAAELVHIGQVAVALGGTLDYFIEAVFNFPTLAECYKVAALDGLNRVRSTQGLPEASYPPQEQTSEV